MQQRHLDYYGNKQLFLPGRKVAFADGVQPRERWIEHVEPEFDTFFVSDAGDTKRKGVVDLSVRNEQPWTRDRLGCAPIRLSAQRDESVECRVATKQHGEWRLIGVLARMEQQVERQLEFIRLAKFVLARESTR